MSEAEKPPGDAPPATATAATPTPAPPPEPPEPAESAVEGDATPPPLGTAEEVREAWGHFRGGETVACPRDGKPLALAVDASAGVYRFVCTQCGVASIWFESGVDGIRVRGSSPSSRGE
jgi:hypothetical protein